MTAQYLYAILEQILSAFFALLTYIKGLEIRNKVLEWKTTLIKLVLPIKGLGVTTKPL
jgi:hypothetical protein